MADAFQELERQVERGSLFTHTALSREAERANENAAVLNGLVDVLVRGGVVSQDDLLAAAVSARAENTRAGDVATPGVMLRVDADPDPLPPVAVDCDARLPVCEAVCCKLRFALSAEEVETGPIKWDLGQPYMNRQDDTGACHCLDHETRGCGIYEARPAVCRTYSCAGDQRIWKDFDAMELNREWIDAHLGADRPMLVEMLMERSPDL